MREQKRLPQRNCKQKDCKVFFQKKKPLDMFCSPECKTQHDKDLLAKRESTSGVKPKYRIPGQSAKRAAEYEEYEIERDIFMALPENKWCPVIQHLENKKVRTVDLHHMNGRTGRRLLDKEFWLAVSRSGHDWIHNNPLEARKMGWLI